jgi:hypothetical protein
VLPTGRAHDAGPDAVKPVNAGGGGAAGAGGTSAAAAGGSSGRADAGGARDAAAGSEAAAQVDAGGSGGAAGAAPDARPDVVIAQGAVKVECVLGDSTDKQVAPQLRVVNVSSSAVDLAGIQLRVWYTNEPKDAQKSQCWFANGGLDCSSITITFVTVSPARTGADTNGEYSFTSASLAPGAYAEIHLGLQSQSWGVYTLTDDYSYCSFTSFTDQPTITAYSGGTLIWGAEP